MNEDKKDNKKNEQEDKTYNIENEEDLINMLNDIMNETGNEPKVIIKNNRLGGLTIKTFNNLFVDYII